MKRALILTVLIYCLALPLVYSQTESSPEIQTIAVPAPSQSFEPAKLFVEENSPVGDFYEFSESFKQLLASTGKVEYAAGEFSAIQTKENTRLDQEYFTKMHIEPITEKEFWNLLLYLIQKQPHAEEGILSNTSQPANRIYFEDKQGRKFFAIVQEHYRNWKLLLYEADPLKTGNPWGEKIFCKKIQGS